MQRVKTGLYRQFVHGTNIPPTPCREGDWKVSQGLMHRWGWRIYVTSIQQFLGVYALVTSCFTPQSNKKLLNACDIYSPPPSVHKTLRDFPVSFSAWAYQALKIPKVSSLDLQRLMCV